MSQGFHQKSIKSGELEIIEFFLDEVDAQGDVHRSYFGMNVAKVIEIIQYPAVTGVPGKRHEAAVGTFRLRDRVLPLVNLSTWLGKKSPLSEVEKVIVCEFSSVVTAFVVSGVMHIHRITWDHVEEPGKHLQAFSHGCITGVIRIKERIIFLLDMEQIVASMDPKSSLAQYITQEGNVQGAGQKILVADDSSAIRALITNCLEQSNFLVTTATTGQDALRILENMAEKSREQNVSLSEFVDLVISDIEMPIMDGHTLVRRIRDHADLKHLPILLFSSIISEVVKQQGIEAGADAHIDKPDLPKLGMLALNLLTEKQKERAKN